MTFERFQPAELTPCQTVDAESFFEEGADDKALGESVARQLCLRDCTVTAECLEFAMRVEENRSRTYRHGLYGGLTPTERSKLAKTRAEKKAADEARELAEAEQAAALVEGMAK